jgi:hypothetical protein
MTFKKLLPHLSAIVIFFLLSVFYFYPQIEGDKLVQGDIVQYKAMAQENREAEQQAGEEVYWNNGMFVGMPWGMLAYGKDLNILAKSRHVLELGFGRPIGFTLKGMLICYICLILLGVNPWLSIAGSIAFGFNVNHIVLIEAGHNNKVEVLTYLPLIMTGLFIVFRKKYLLGGLLLAIGTSFVIFHNHPQMLYYYGLTLTILGVAFVIHTVMKKEYMHLLKSIGVLVLAAALGFASNAAQLAASQAFSEDTMRGAPILEKEGAQQAKSSSEVEGLEWEYAMNWSNQVKDLYSFLIPGAVGGSSSREMGPKTRTARLLRNYGAPRESGGVVRAPMYWGELPFTSGPYYVGAVLLLLFAVGLYWLKPVIRYGVLTALLFGFLLSMGSEAEWLNRFLFENFPYFNKFRAPNSVVNVLPTFFIIPGFIGIQKFLSSKSKDKQIKSIYIGTAIIGGFCLIMALLGPSLFDFSGPGDQRFNKDLLDTIIEDRKSILTSDAFRSLIFALLSGLLLWLFANKRLKSTLVLSLGIILLTIIDLFPVDKRYLDEDNFTAERRYEQQFQPRQVDQQIFKREPKGRGYYRVLDYSINTFNSASTSYHHNTIGGYYAAKLQRIQDMIDYHISNGNRQVLNMLNTKYIINKDEQLQVNRQALGNAWFVENLVTVNTPKQEIEALDTINTARTAVILADDFKGEVDQLSAGNGRGSISLQSYRPDKLIYKSQSSSEQLAVFSETWYGPNKGWTVTIDGEEVPMLRVNYMLRAVKVPAGEHTIKFTFEPKIPKIYSGMTLVCSIILSLVLLGKVGIEIRKQL